MPTALTAAQKFTALDPLSRQRGKAAIALTGATDLNEEQILKKILTFTGTAGDLNVSFPKLGTGHTGMCWLVDNQTNGTLTLRAYSDDADNTSFATDKVTVLPHKKGVVTWNGSGFDRDRTLARRYSYCDFRHNPVTAKIAGGAATGSAGDENVMILPDGAFEYHILGTQTILAPALTATGLDVSMDQTDNDGVEIGHGILSRNPFAFTVGTDGAFQFSVKLKIADVSGTDDCAVGFRKAEAYQANIDDYDEMACLNVISGDIKIETILNAAATVTTDTTDNWADAATKKLTVKVSAAGVVTYQIDDAAPTVVAAYTFDNGEVVMPFFYFLHASDVAGAVELIEWECGFQADIA